MIRKLICLFLLSAVSGTWLTAQMALPESVRQESHLANARHVPAGTWTAGSGDPAESAREALPALNAFHFTLSPELTGDYATLRVFLPQSERISLAILDREGNLVHEISEPYTSPAGAHAFSIPLNHRPRLPLAPGLYFVRLQVGTEFHRLPVVKS